VSDHIDKIKKLLRLAQNKAASPAEAANALRRALELVDRHNLDIESLNLDEEQEKLFSSSIPMGERRSFIKRQVNGILLNHFHVRTCWGYCKLYIVGFEHDVTIAGYVFDFLVRALTKALSEFAAQERKHRRKVTVLKKKNFIQGWIYGVAANLRERAPEDTLDDSRAALICANREKQVDAYFDQEFPDIVTSKPVKIQKNTTALMKGWLQGQSVSITTPLAGTCKEQLRLN